MTGRFKHWTRFVPYLEFYICIPLLTVKTHILTRPVDRMTFDIIRLRVKLWKWEGEFDLYQKERW